MEHKPFDALRGLREKLKREEEEKKARPEKVRSENERRDAEKNDRPLPTSLRKSAMKSFFCERCKG